MQEGGSSQAPDVGPVPHAVGQGALEIVVIQMPAMEAMGEVKRGGA